MKKTTVTQRIGPITRGTQDLPDYIAEAQKEATSNIRLPLKIDRDAVLKEVNVSTQATKYSPVDRPGVVFDNGLRVTLSWGQYQGTSSAKPNSLVGLENATKDAADRLITHLEGELAELLRVCK
jgi:hypothetical protein